MVLHSNVFFSVMYKGLDLNYDVLSKRSHKRLNVEHFHCFLNRAVTIAMEDRKSNDVFVPVGIAAGYAWNNAPIDGTHISRSTVAIGHEVWFQIDINLSAALPQLIQNNAQSTIDYSRFTYSNYRFSSSILKLLIKNCRTTHAGRVNNNKKVVELDIDDTVLAKTIIHGNISTNKVAKLNHQVRGSFCIIKCSGRRMYLVRKLYKTDNIELKFMATDLYSLPPSLKLCKPVDNSEIWYSNQLYSPIVINSLINTLKFTMKHGLINNLRHINLCLIIIILLLRFQNLN